MLVLCCGNGVGRHTSTTHPELAFRPPTTNGGFQTHTTVIQTHAIRTTKRKMAMRR